MVPELETLMDQYVPIINDSNSARDLLASDVSSKRDIRAAVLALLGDLRAHFTIEESSNGFLATLSREHPDSLGQINAFRREHAELIASTTELEQLLERETEDPSWRSEVLQSMSELVHAFLEHEQREDEWIAAHLPLRR